MVADTFVTTTGQLERPRLLVITMERAVAQGSGVMTKMGNP